MPRWLRLTVVAIVVPVALLAGLEAALRAVRYGNPTTLFIPVTIGGCEFVTLNQAIGQRFFSNPNVAGKFTPLPEVFPREKGTNTLRIFVFGESAARGMLYEEFSFARMLREMLEEACPGRTIEIIDTGVNAIDSWVVRTFVKEALAYQPDLFIFYCGNNELVGPFGPASLSSALGATGRALSRVRLWLSSLRVSQLANAVNARLTGSDRNALSKRWQAIQVRQHLSHDDPRRARAYESFRRNLGAMTAWAAAAGVPSVICTLGANIADFPPMAPLVSPALAPGEQQTLTALVAEAQARLDENAYGAAMAAARTAFELDPACADALFVLGSCYEAEGALATASYWYTQAVICDGMPTRTGPELNPIVRTAFGATPALCDTAAALAHASSNGMIGADLVFDHVHLTLPGHYVVASTLYHTVSATCPGSAKDQPPLTAEQCLVQLGCSRWDVCRAYHETATFLLNNATFSNHLHYGKWRADIERRYGAFITEDNWRYDTALVEEAIAVYSNALAFHPQSWELLLRLAQACVTRKDFSAAIAAAEQAYALNPFREIEKLLAEAYRGRGLHNLEAGDPAGAAHDLAVTIELERRLNAVTNVARVCTFRAQALLKLKRYADVVASLDEALALQPDDAAAYNARGFAYFQLGHSAQAVSDYTTSLTLQNRNGKAYYNRAYAYAKLQRYGEAVADVAAAQQLGYPVESQFVNFLKSHAVQHRNQSPRE